MNRVDCDESHPAAVALRASVATPPRQGQRVVDAVIERVMAIHLVGGALVYEASHGCVILTGGDLRVELWRSGHWHAMLRGQTIGTAASVEHGGRWLEWVADRIDVEATHGRLRNSPFR